MKGSLTRQGAGMIAGFEGLYLYGYPDPGTGGEPITDGLGHTAAAGGHRPRLNVRITMAQALATFLDDAGRFVAEVNAAVHDGTTELGLLPTYSKDALYSWHYNAGAIRSGSVDDKLNRGDVAGALATLGAYVNAAGKRLPGLVTRRADEIALFKTGRYPSRPVTFHERPGAAARSIAVSALPWDPQPAPVIGDDLMKPVGPVAPEPAVKTTPPPVPEKQNFLIDLWRSATSWLSRR